MSKKAKKNAKAMPLTGVVEENGFIEVEEVDPYAEEDLYGTGEDLCDTELVIECISEGGFDEDDESIIERVRLL